MRGKPMNIFHITYHQAGVGFEKSISDETRLLNKALKYNGEYESETRQ